MAGNPKKNNLPKKKTTQDRLTEDFETNKILTVFVGTFAVIMLLVFAYRGYSHMNTYLASYYGSYIAAAAAAVGAVVFGLFAWRDHKRGIKREYKVFTPKNLCFACLLLCFCGLVSGRYDVRGIKLLYAIVPSVALLALIPMIFPRDFFWIALVTGCGVLAMYVYSKEISELILWLRDFSFRSFAVTVLILALLAAWALLVRRVQRADGRLKLGKLDLEYYPKNTHYVFSYLTAGVVALCTLIAYVFGSVAAYYMMFLLLAYLFAMAVIYTVKML